MLSIVVTIGFCDVTGKYRQSTYLFQLTNPKLDTFDTSNLIVRQSVCK